VLVAVSGGGDSVALLHRLRAEPCDLLVAHVNHGLRSGAASDARFVQELCDEWDLPCRILQAPVRRSARLRRMGVEEAGRYERYRLLARLAAQWKCRAVVTAHTADDQAETVLMNFLRGTHPAGLAGMPFQRPIHSGSAIPLIRPLLMVRRAAVRGYLAHHGLRFREDPSNRQLRYTRNRIRLKLLPLLEKQFPGLSERLVKRAGIFSYHGKRSVDGKDVPADADIKNEDNQ